MSSFAAGNQPGFQSTITADEPQITWSGRHDQDLIATRGVTIDSTSVDSGNSPTTTLRGGTIMAIKQSTGKAHPYQANASDGTQNPIGVLEHNQDMQVDGQAQDRFTQILVQGMLKESEIHNLDPHAKEVLAGRFQFDQAPIYSDSALMHPRGTHRKSSNYTVLAEESGSLFIADAAVNFTLPTAEVGLSYRFLQTADGNLTITGSSNILFNGSSSASSLACSTSSEKIGSHILVECVYTDSSTLRWIASDLGGTTITIT